jgi:hypothetical protein
MTEVLKRVEIGGGGGNGNSGRLHKVAVFVLVFPFVSKQV